MQKISKKKHSKVICLSVFNSLHHGFSAVHSENGLLPLPDAIHCCSDITNQHLGWHDCRLGHDHLSLHFSSNEASALIELQFYIFQSVCLSRRSFVQTLFTSLPTPSFFAACDASHIDVFLGNFPLFRAQLSGARNILASSLYLHPFDERLQQTVRLIPLCFFAGWFLANFVILSSKLCSNLSFPTSLLFPRSRAFFKREFLP